MGTLIKDFKELVIDGTSIPQGWRLQAVVNGDNMTYLVAHEGTREALVLDPMREDWDALVNLCQEYAGYRFLGVMDTHTHADHVSCAARLAEHLGVPLIMSEKSPSQRVQLRVSRDLVLQTAAGPLTILVAPGHAPDSLIPIWGPFLFAGDTLLHGDTGRDDLPGGDPEAHYETIRKLHAHAKRDTLILPGHDELGGRATSWKTQLELNASLTQDRETFVREAGSYSGPPPKALKESLFENFK